MPLLQTRPMACARAAAKQSRGQVRKSRTAQRTSLPWCPTPLVRRHPPAESAQALLQMTLGRKKLEEGWTRIFAMPPYTPSAQAISPEAAQAPQQRFWGPPRCTSTAVGSCTVPAQAVSSSRPRAYAPKLPCRHQRSARQAAALQRIMMYSDAFVTRHTSVPRKPLLRRCGTMHCN